MKIKLWAALMDDTLEASVQGDVITINGEVIDLSVIPVGYKLPGSAVKNKFFFEGDYIQRINGVLNFTLRLPVRMDSPEEYRNPVTPIILDVVSGNVPFPDTTPIPVFSMVEEVQVDEAELSESEDLNNDD